MKSCSSCKIEKSLNDFNKNKSQKDGLQRICKICSKASDKKCYSKQGPLIRKIRNLEVINRNKKFILKYKKIFGKCVDCGVKDYRVLQFDHIKDKKHNISDMIYEGRKIQIIKEEIRKCEIRCANCHQIKTFYS